MTCQIGLLDTEGNLIEETAEETPVEGDVGEGETPEGETPEGETPLEETPEPEVITSGWIYNITFSKRREEEIKLVAITANLTTETSIISVCNWWNHVSDPVSGTFTLSLDEVFTTVILINS